MSTPNRNLSSVQRKEEIAQQYSNKIKEIARRFNIDTQRLIREYYPLIQRAIKKGRSVENIIDSLIREIEELLASLIKTATIYAIQREEQDEDTILPLLAVSVEQCSLEYYTQTLEKYSTILKDEVKYAVENGYEDDLTLLLSNPQGYMAGKKGGLSSLKEATTQAGQGVSYSFTENMRKLGVSVVALAYTNAMLWLWQRKGEIVGYYGKRNSNYPCPLCDSYAYVFIPIEQGMVYPLHNRCVCSIIPLLRDEIL